MFNTNIIQLIGQQGYEETFQYFHLTAKPFCETFAFMPINTLIQMTLFLNIDNNPPVFCWFYGKQGPWIVGGLMTKNGGIQLCAGNSPCIHCHSFISSVILPVTVEGTMDGPLKVTPLTMTLNRDAQ